MLRYKTSLTEQFEDLNDPLLKQIMKEGGELYRLGCEIFDCSTLRLCCSPQSLAQRLQKLSLDKPTDTSNELYWTIKPKRRPIPREKWQFGGNECYSSFSRAAHLADVFDYSATTCLRSERITFRIRNWKQKPTQSLKKKTCSSFFGLASEFSLLSRSSLRPISKCFLSHSTSSIYNPSLVIL